MGSILPMLAHPGQPQGNPESCSGLAPAPQQQKFRRCTNVSAQQTNCHVPSWKDSGCSAELTTPLLPIPWNRNLLFRVEKQIFTAVFIPHPWTVLRRVAPGTCQQTARHGCPSLKCHPHPPAQAEFRPLASALPLALCVCRLMKELMEKPAGLFVTVFFD